MSDVVGSCGAKLPPLNRRADLVWEQVQRYSKHRLVCNGQEDHQRSAWRQEADGRSPAGLVAT